MAAPVSSTPPPVIPPKVAPGMLVPPKPILPPRPVSQQYQSPPLANRAVNNPPPVSPKPIIAPRQLPTLPTPPPKPTSEPESEPEPVIVPRKLPALPPKPINEPEPEPVIVPRQLPTLPALPPKPVSEPEPEPIKEPPPISEETDLEEVTEPEEIIEINQYENEPEEQYANEEQEVAQTFDMEENHMYVTGSTDDCHSEEDVSNPSDTVLEQNVEPVSEIMAEANQKPPPIPPKRFTITLNNEHTSPPPHLSPRSPPLNSPTHTPEKNLEQPLPPLPSRQSINTPSSPLRTQMPPNPFAKPLPTIPSPQSSPTMSHPPLPARPPIPQKPPTPKVAPLSQSLPVSSPLMDTAEEKEAEMLEPALFKPDEKAKSGYRRSLLIFPTQRKKSQVKNRCNLFFISFINVQIKKRPHQWTLKRA